MFKNRNLIRLLYILIGGYTAISAFIENDWFISILGLLFISMGVFNLGCAGKKCRIKNEETSNQKSKNTITKEIEYEEIK